MDEATDKNDASGDRTLTIAGLCVCVFAARLGVISLGAGMHRLSLAQTCASAAAVCLIANSLWMHRLWQVGIVVLPGNSCVVRGRFHLRSQRVVASRKQERGGE
jgi:hypothetical protein